MENLEFKQEIIRQMLFIGSILAGFAFTVVVQLLNREGKTKIVFWSATAFIASTMSLLVATIGGAILLFASNVLALRPLRKWLPQPMVCSFFSPSSLSWE